MSESHKALRILVVNRDASVGGGTTLIWNMGHALRAMGHHPLLITGSGPMRKVLDEAYECTLDEVYVFQWQWRKLARRIRELHPDVLNVHSPRQMLIAIPAAGATGVPLAVTFGSADKPERASRIVNRVDMVQVMNRQQWRYYEELGAPTDRLAIVRYMVDVHRYTARAKPYNERRYDFAYCSRLSGQKGPLALGFLGGFERLLTQRPNLSAIVIGFGKFYGRALEAAQRINRQAGREAVKVVEHELDTSVVFGDTRNVVGSGCVGIEALVSGCNLISAGFDGVVGRITPETFMDGVENHFGDHVIFEHFPTTPDRFAALMEEALDRSTEDERRQLQQLTMDTFSRETVAIPLEAALRQVIAGPVSRSA